jgi:hypothetical protein
VIGIESKDGDRDRDGELNGVRGEGKTYPRDNRRGMMEREPLLSLRLPNHKRGKR